MICTACGDPEQNGMFCVGCGAQLRNAPPSPMPVPASAPTTTEHKTQARAAGAESYLKLEPSETAVLHAASRIYAAYLRSGQVDDVTESAMVEKSVRLAMHMAIVTDRMVQSDDEEW